MTEAHIIIEDLPQNDTTKHVKLISISGQLDESNIDEKAQEIYALITQNPQGLSLIFDFEKLEYMNSKSIGYLTDWFGKITEAQGKIVIAKAKPNIIDILQVIGLTQLIPMLGSLEEAKFAIFSAGENGPASVPALAVEPSPVISMPQPIAPTPIVTPEQPAAPVVEQPAPTPTPVVEQTTPPGTVS